MKLAKLGLAVIALLLSVTAVHAQVPPTPPEGTYVIAVGATYNTTGGATNDGSVETVEYHINDYFNARLDAFTFGGGLLASTGRAQAQAALSHLVKGNEFLDTARMLPFVNAGGGVVKNPSGATKPAWAIGAGLDYKVNDTLTIRAIDFTLLGSTIIPNGHTSLSNIKNVATGIYLTFPSHPSLAFLQKRAARRAAKRQRDLEKAQRRQ